MGQRWLTIHGIDLSGISPRKSIRKRRILFGISVSQRVRNIPDDRLGEIAYLDSLGMTEVIDTVIPIIESEAMFQLFKTNLDTILVPPSQTTPSYDPNNPPDGVPPRYQLTDSFIYESCNLDPIHLYPADFYTRAGNDKEELYDKIAGYRMTARFYSPEFQETKAPILCNPIDISLDASITTVTTDTTRTTADDIIL